MFLIKLTADTIKFSIILFKLTRFYREKILNILDKTNMKNYQGKVFLSNYQFKESILGK